jgi:hypothetical protein
MRKFLLVLLSLSALTAVGQSAFDGTWRLNTESSAYKGHEKFSLQNGTYRCDTCNPKVVVKADGTPQKVVGSPYYDTSTVHEMDDHTVEISTSKDGKPTGKTKLIASDDGKKLTVEWSFIAESGKEGHGKYTSERVGEAPASANKISGTWQPGKMESASQEVTTVTYKATEEGLSMSDPVGDAYNAKFDGKDYPYKGDPGITSVSLKKIDAKTIEETDKRNGKVITVSRMTVAPDGKSMDITVDDKLHNATVTWKADKQ